MREPEESHDSTTDNFYKPETTATAEMNNLETSQNENVHTSQADSTEEQSIQPNIADQQTQCTASQPQDSSLASSDEHTQAQTQLRRRVARTDANTERSDRNHDDTATPSSSSKEEDKAHTTARETPKGKERAENSSSAKMHNEANDEFSCNICFDTATDPVLTICGHLFCWSCLVQWLERSATCPVCKAGCDKDKVIPVYGRGKEEKDPRLNTNIPNRPAGQRPPPPPPRQANQFFGFDPFAVPGSFHTMGMARARTPGGGTVFVGGLGFIPALMGFYSLSSSAGAPNGAQGVNGNGQPVGQQAFASRVFMMLAAMVLISIFFY
ncbi:hypothetical protein J3B02_003847 [Coemansia erecta]|uniref:RING-type E3 ubiquitin transferase n=1 Tax=Coemansia asiatica TaxID=1052880 RepID=A0A9W7XJN4_9FUNG|nr:hypothetical protein LPJ64_004181 [Coemansia asiatica]KAJ2849059.1 hypothetical protein J3B02_003847 [Coemansia erecta]KAJ2862688.1 hypothetical protein FB639_005361 [Coemansia asiatica]